MTPRRRAQIGATIAALVLGLTMGPAQASTRVPAASGTAAAGAAAPAGVAAATSYTTITFVLDNCSKCSIDRVVRAISYDSKVTPHYPDYRDFTVRRLSGNRYRTKVPSAVTRGLSFEIDATWRGVGGTLGYRSNIATRYVGYKVGARVSITKAKRASKAYACWAGTAATTKTIHVSVRKVAARSYEGTRVWDLQAWSTRGLRSVGKAEQKLPGNQEAYYC